MTPRRTTGGTPATLALGAAGVAHTLRPYDPDPAVASYGPAAAAALGVDPARVLKTLVASAGGRLVVAVLPVHRRLDLKALAATVGAKQAELAEPSVAERATGYVVGGISPFGQRRHLPTVVDAAAMRHTTVFVSAGRRGLDVEVDPADLCRLTGAVTAPIASG